MNPVQPDFPRNQSLVCSDLCKKCSGNARYRPQGFFTALAHPVGVRARAVSRPPTHTSAMSVYNESGKLFALGQNGLPFTIQKCAEKVEVRARIEDISVFSVAGLFSEHSRHAARLAWRSDSVTVKNVLSLAQLP